MYDRDTPRALRAPYVTHDAREALVVLHPEAPPAAQYRMRLTVGEHSAGHVRRILRYHLDEWSLPELSGSAELALTELLANVVRHVPDRVCVLHIRRRPDGVRVEVADGAPQLPRVRDAGPMDEAGRGLRLVAAVTDRWGVEPGGGGQDGNAGKTVWFECCGARVPARAYAPGPAPGPTPGPAPGPAPVPGAPLSK